MPQSELVHAGLKALAKSVNLAEGDFQAFIKELLTKLSFTLDIPRVSLWLHQEETSVFRLNRLYDKVADSFVSGEFIDGMKHNLLYDELRAEVSNELVLNELKVDFLSGIKSMLIQQIWVDGELFGFLALEDTVAERKWFPEEKKALAIASGYVIQAFQKNSFAKERLSITNHSATLSSIFKNIPLPMWLYNSNTKRVLDANEEALNLYGYSPSEFKTLKADDLGGLMDDNIVEEEQNDWEKEVRQVRKNGEDFFVKISILDWSYDQIPAKAVIIQNALSENHHEKERERLEKRLSDHAFYTSHNIRSPLANILGLLDLIKVSWEDREHYEDLLYRLKIQTMNLDEAVRVMTAKIELD